MNDRNKKRAPPYVSYRSFLNLIDDLKLGIPGRIDRSYWGDKFSGTTGTQLISALRFLNLVDVNEAPTNQLRAFVASKGANRTETLKKICQESYSFLLSESFQAETATYGQIEEVFHDLYSVDRDVARKCIKFFMEIAKESGIQLSPFITKKSKCSKTNSATEKIPKKSGTRTNINTVVPNTAELVPHAISWKELLLSKFPNFDPTWPSDVQLKWFEAFDELLKRGFISSHDDH